MRVSTVLIVKPVVDISLLRSETLLGNETLRDYHVTFGKVDPLLCILGFNCKYLLTFVTLSRDLCYSGCIC